MTKARLKGGESEQKITINLSQYITMFIKRKIIFIKLADYVEKREKFRSNFEVKTAMSHRL